MNDRMTEILLLQWAEHHPYLFTIIKIASPALYVVILFAGIQIIGSMFRGGRR